MAVSSTRIAIRNSLTRSATAFQADRITTGVSTVVSRTSRSATPSTPTW